ncbi:MAG: Ribosomal RNA small subunit methyltransferase E [Candidatus Anoxychlamydiales bacterium]|nr:Ribosomal RNA small subunit methyltransferase E [Candidatus Anoxychlamydiales bacterium]NGX36576.1 Ribosomal RNA small subunit methyltransferase E [Candidatus Anoxychlamydiales bacterium]
MPKDRYFTDQTLKKDTSLKLIDKEAHHLRTSMRKKEKDVVEIINGRGFLAKCIVEKIESKAATLHIEEVVFKEAKKQRIKLIQAFIKPPKIDLILEKCTELGCNDFWFFNSSASEKVDISKNRFERMNHLLIATLKQCGALYLPKIKIFKTMRDIKNLEGQKFFGSLDETEKKSMDIDKKTTENISFFIGPEIGFSKEEISYLKEVLKAKGIKLNSNILRAETAAIAAVAITSHFLQS